MPRLSPWVIMGLSRGASPRQHGHRAGGPVLRFRRQLVVASERHVLFSSSFQAPGRAVCHFEEWHAGAHPCTLPRPRHPDGGTLDPPSATVRLQASSDPSGWSSNSLEGEPASTVPSQLRGDPRILQAKLLERVASPPPGDLPNPGSNPCFLRLLHSGASFTTAPSGKSDYKRGVGIHTRRFPKAAKRTVSTIY